MKFGLPLFGLSPRHYAEVARAAEHNGFESVWMPEHLVLPAEIPPTYLYSESGYPPIAAQTPLYDPWVVLGAIATATESIRLATNIFILPLRHPIATARTVVTLDRLSGGRVTLGVGVGWLEEEFDAVGQGFHDRGGRTDEIIPLLRRLWTDEIIEHRGDHFAFGPVRFEPKPVQKSGIPIEIGGASRPALRRAGRLGDGWVEIGSSGLDELAGRLAVVEQGRREAGREHLPFEVSAGLAGDPDEVRRGRDIGVTRIISGPPAAAARLSRHDVLDWIKRFADDVIAKCQG